MTEAQRGLFPRTKITIHEDSDGRHVDAAMLFERLAVALKGHQYKGRLHLEIDRDGSIFDETGRCLFRPAARRRGKSRVD